LKELSDPRKIKAERGVVVPLPVRSEEKKKIPPPLLFVVANFTTAVVSLLHVLR
jgi:hypothetical protein